MCSRRRSGRNGHDDILNFLQQGVEASAAGSIVFPHSSPLVPESCHMFQERSSIPNFAKALAVGLAISLLNAGWGPSQQLGCLTAPAGRVMLPYCRPDKLAVILVKLQY